MKTMLIFSALILSAGAQATEINATYTGKNYSYRGLLVENVKRAAPVFARTLGSGLGCSDVELCLTDATKVKLFGPGSFTVTLTASCTSEISSFDFSLSTGADWEDDIILGMNYSAPNGASASPTRYATQAPYGKYSDRIGALPMCFKTPGLVEADDSDRATEYSN